MESEEEIGRVGGGVRVERGDLLLWHRRFSKDSRWEEAAVS